MDNEAVFHMLLIIGSCLLGLRWGWVLCEYKLKEKHRIELIAARKETISGWLDLPIDDID